MIETKIKWNDGKIGEVVKDGTIELAEKKAIEEVKQLAEVLYEIAHRYGVSLSVSACDYVDASNAVVTYKDISASYIKGGIQHCTNSFVFGDGKYFTNMYISDRRDAGWKDSPREAVISEEHIKSIDVVYVTH